MPRSFALGSYFEAFIDAQVEGGRYNNASEVVRDALRLLEEKERRREMSWAALRKAVQEGLDSPMLERMERSPSIGSGTSTAQCGPPPIADALSFRSRGISRP